MADMAWLAAPVAALAAACWLLVTLGSQVLARGVVFIDLAVAQVAALGVLAAGGWLEGLPAQAGMLAAAVAALAGSGLVWWLARAWPSQREALIGLVYVGAASACMVSVSFDPHGRERLTALLAADVLWVSWGAVLGLALLAVIVSILAARRLLARDAVFYPAFALAMSVAVQALGLYLVFALLIGPALWTRRGASGPQAVVAVLAGSLAALGVSWWLDWPSGPLVALAACGLGLAALIARRPDGS